MSKRKTSSPCKDCRVETLPNDHRRAEWYDVTEEVWAASGLELFGGYLCIGCLEARLGRRLTPADFTDAPVNDVAKYSDTPRYAWSYRTPRLLSRLTGRDEAEVQAEVEDQQVEELLKLVQARAGDMGKNPTTPDFTELLRRDLKKYLQEEST